MTGGSPSAAIAAAWEQHFPTMLERVDVLERAVTGLADGALDGELAERAVTAAHQLAGTVGTFGFPRASAHARELELALRGGADAQAAPTLAGLVAGIREDFDAPPFVATTAPAPAASAEAAPTAPLPLVLLVMPDPITSERYRIEAGRRGLRVAVAEPARALELAARQPPAAVILDLACPDGLLADLARLGAPVLALAAADGFEHRLAAARGGAAALLEAGSTPAEVMDQVALALQRRAVTGSRVLVVAEEATAVAGVLGEAGFEVVAVTDPARAWEELERVNPAVVLVDADLPDVFGLELCRVLRNDRRWSVVPVILLVDQRDPDTVSQMFAVAADDLLARPDLERELVARVESHLQRHRLHQALADTDALTGLNNRRTSSAALSGLIRMAERLDKPMCLAQLDVDNFKRVNDVRGHIAGDAVLRRLGDLLRRSFRTEDVIARWGGEEFVVGLFGVPRNFGIDRLAAVLSDFRAEVFEAGGEEFSVTFSAGVAQYPTDGADLESLYNAADEALYAAKHAGRDQVVGAGGGHRTTQQVDVAIVEDEDAASELIADTLSGRGHRCWRFSNGASAVSMLAGDIPSVRARVILLDLNMPAVNGMELLTLLSQDGVLRSSRVIVVSARDDPDTVARVRALGAEDYVVKPVDLDDLSRRVETALGRR